jgi:hypothetical protein
MMACSIKDGEDLVELLIKKGADVSMKSKNLLTSYGSEI